LVALLPVGPSEASCRRNQAAVPVASTAVSLAMAARVATPAAAAPSQSAERVRVASSVPAPMSASALAGIVPE